MTDDQRLALNARLNAAVRARRASDPRALLARALLLEETVADLTRATQGLADAVRVQAEAIAALQDNTGRIIEVLSGVLSHLGCERVPPALKLVGGPVTDGPVDAPRPPRRPAG